MKAGIVIQYRPNCNEAQFPQKGTIARKANGNSGR